MHTNTPCDDGSLFCDQRDETNETPPPRQNPAKKAHESDAEYFARTIDRVRALRAARPVDALAARQPDPLCERALSVCLRRCGLC